MKFTLVDEWSTDTPLVTFTQKTIEIPFDKIFHEDELSVLNSFNIIQDRYSKRSDIVCQYINYFIEFYDTDHELLLAYLRLKLIIDNPDTKCSTKSFINIMYKTMFTDTMIAKIRKMVDDNYIIDLTPKKSNKTYLDILQFTNEHGKMLMEISLAMKLMIPVIFHYISTNNLSKISFQFYEKLFTIFGEAGDIYSKLWHTVSAKVNKHRHINDYIWSQKEIFGKTPELVLEELLIEKLINENMFRYVFSLNPINFNSVILRNQLDFFNSETYPATLAPLTNEPDSEGLSRLDRFFNNTAHVDESYIIMRRPNIENILKEIKRHFHIRIPKEEIDFYINSMPITNLQIQLVGYFFINKFNNYMDLYMLTKRQYVYLCIVMKKYLQSCGHLFLPQIVTGTVDGKINSKSIQNVKFLDKLENSSVYNNLIKTKYNVLVTIKQNKDNPIVKLISTLLNTQFLYLDFVAPSMNGQPIVVTQDILADECLYFISLI